MAYGGVGGVGRCAKESGFAVSSDSGGLVSGRGHSLNGQGQSALHL